MMIWRRRVTTLSDATSIQHDTFDVAVIDLNLRGHPACPIVDDLTRIRNSFVFTTAYGVGAIPDRFGHARRREKPYDRRATRGVGHWSEASV